MNSPVTHDDSASRCSPLPRNQDLVLFPGNQPPSSGAFQKSPPSAHTAHALEWPGACYDQQNPHFTLMALKQSQEWKTRDHTSRQKEDVPSSRYSGNSKGFGSREPRSRDEGQIYMRNRLQSSDMLLYKFLKNPNNTQGFASQPCLTVLQPCIGNVISETQFPYQKMWRVPIS